MTLARARGLRHLLSTGKTAGWAYFAVPEQKGIKTTTKKRQQADIATALSLHDEYPARKKRPQSGPPPARGTR